MDHLEISHAGQRPVSRLKFAETGKDQVSLHWGQLCGV